MKKVIFYMLLLIIGLNTHNALCMLNDGKDERTVITQQLSALEEEQRRESERNCQLTVQYLTKNPSADRHLPKDENLIKSNDKLYQLVKKKQSLEERLKAMEGDSSYE